MAVPLREYFEGILSRNNGGQGFLIGDKLTVADLAVSPGAHLHVEICSQQTSNESE